MSVFKDEFKDGFKDEFMILTACTCGAFLSTERSRETSPVVINLLCVCVTPIWLGKTTEANAI